MPTKAAEANSSRDLPDQGMISSMMRDRYEHKVREEGDFTMGQRVLTLSKCYELEDLRCKDLDASLQTKSTSADVAEALKL